MFLRSCVHHTFGNLAPKFLYFVVSGCGCARAKIQISLGTCPIIVISSLGNWDFVAQNRNVDFRRLPTVREELFQLCCPVGQNRILCVVQLGHLNHGVPDHFLNQCPDRGRSHRLVWSGDIRKLQTLAMPQSKLVQTEDANACDQKPFDQKN